MKVSEMNSQQPQTGQESEETPQELLQQAKTALEAWRKIVADEELSREAAHAARQMVRSLAAEVRLRQRQVALDEEPEEPPEEMMAASQEKANM